MIILKKDQIVVGEVVDIVNADYVLISFDGRLVRVHNASGRPLEVGERIRLRVHNVNPLGFQIVVHARGKLSLDVLG